MASVIELASPLSADECAARLRSAIDRDGLLLWFGSRPVVGRVSGRSVRLRQRIWYNNSFQTFLSGVLVAEGAGCIFRGRAGMHPLVTAFMAVWFGGVVIIGGTLLIAAVQGRLVGSPPLLGAVVPPLMLMFGVGLVRFGRWLARDEEAFLVAFVAETISAGGESGAVRDIGRR